MDFIEGLPTSKGASTIFVIIDMLSKYADFLCLNHPYTAQTVAQVFMQQMFRLHGMPKSIVSDRDPVFTSAFWQEIFRVQGTILNLSSAYHPETDGQTEMTNKSLEHYLRSFVGDKPKSWAKWLPLAEWWYNTTTHSATKMFPFEVVYGYPPPKLISYESNTTRIAAVDEALKSREEISRLLHHNLKESQNRMRKFEDRKRTGREFIVGD